MLLSNTGVGNMTIPSSKIVINTRHTTSERKFRVGPRAREGAKALQDSDEIINGVFIQ
jgi:hypothetical protein